MKNLSPSPSPEGRGGEERRGGNDSPNGGGLEGALYQRYARRLQGFFLRQLGHDAQAAADATHDTFLRAFEAMRRVVPSTDFATAKTTTPNPSSREEGTTNHSFWGKSNHGALASQKKIASRGFLGKPNHSVPSSGQEGAGVVARGSRDEAAWLFTIAYNLLRNRYRHQAYEAEFLATLDRQPMDTADIELHLDRQTLLTALKEVLDELPPPLRLLFSLHYEEELTVPQVAAILQVPEGTVKSRLHKTMTIIRKKLKEYEK